MCSEVGNVACRRSVFLILMCGVNSEQPLNVADISRSISSPEGDQLSSYDTGQSSQEGPMDKQTDNTGDALTDSLEAIKGSIAALDGTHNVMADRLASLEKVVTSVREDMTWVKDDVRVVHEILEKLADYVSMLMKTVVEVDGVQAHTPPHDLSLGPME